jgi:hypothetical protein
MSKKRNMSMHRGLILVVAVTVIVLVGFFNYVGSHDINAEVTHTVKLDKNTYTWTDRVNIRVIAPDQNLDPNQIDTINVTVSTRGNSISPYTLVETGPNTGIFTGFVTLTGDPTIKDSIGVDGKGKNPTGAGPSGVGPTDGLLPTENSDGISVTFQTQSQSVTASAKIQWNLGQVTWLSPVTSSARVLQILDTDMNLNPSAIDSFLTPVFSNSDLAGVTLKMTETGPNTGIFRGIVHFTNFTSSANKLHLSGGNNTITGDYTDRTLPSYYTSGLGVLVAADQIVINATTSLINGNTTAGPPITIKLDKNTYTWTDRVGITVIAPSLNLDPNKIETIGNNILTKITISTRGNTILHYKLVETGSNTGIFTGNVTLTGNPNILGFGGVDGAGTQPTGSGPTGVGPRDGLLPAQNIDGISATIQTPEQTVTATAPIAWNISQVTWLQLIYPTTDHGVCQIVDPDMNLNQFAIDKFFVNVWSTTDSGGIKLSMNETGKSTGIYQGFVFFTNSPSSGNRLQVNHSDTVTCEYKDRTLPPPYTPADQLRHEATTSIK